MGNSTDFDNKEIKSTDSTIRIEYNCGDIVYYNEPKDSIAFFMKRADDSSDYYYLKHYKLNGDTVVYRSPKNVP